MRWALVLLVACGGSSSDPVEPEATLPSIVSIDPDVVSVGSPAQTIKIVGDGFDANAIVLFGADERVPVSASANELAIEITAGDTLFPSVHQVRVINPGVGRNASNVARLDVVIPNGVPIVSALAPDQAIVGAADLAVEIRGSDFAPGASVTWGGEPIASMRIDDALVMVVVPAAKLATIGSTPVVVTNPKPGGGASVPRTFLVRDLAAPAGVLARASVSGTGGELAGSSNPSFVSDNGRYVAFVANPNGVLPGDTNNTADLFVRDTCTGESSCTPSTIALSTKPDGTFGTAQVFLIAATGDMRYVAFAGTFDQVPSLSGVAIVIRDTCIGATSCTPETYQASPEMVNQFDSFDLSDDGRYLAFVTANALVASDTNSSLDVYIRDNCRGASGCTPSTILVSATGTGAAGNSGGHKLSMSADGRYVAFHSSSSNLVAGDTNGTLDIYVRDTCIGASGCTPSTVRASVDAADAGGSFDATDPSIDRGGRYVMFMTRSRLATTDIDNVDDIYVRDTCFGAASCTPTTFHATPNDINPQTRGPRALALGGRYIAYGARDTTNSRDDAFVRDTCINTPGCTTTVRAINTSGTAPDRGADRQIRISRDGRHASIDSRASNLVPNDTNDQTDVFLASTGF